MRTGAGDATVGDGGASLRKGEVSVRTAASAAAFSLERAANQFPPDLTYTIALDATQAVTAG